MLKRASLASENDSALPLYKIMEQEKQARKLGKEDGNILKLAHDMYKLHRDRHLLFALIFRVYD